jgi:DNA polymerase-1
MKLLVDGDLVTYPSAASCEKRDKDGNVLSLEEKHIAEWRCGATLNALQERWKTDDIEIFLSGDNSFRYRIDPEYKANRKGKPRPVHLYACQELLVLQYGAKVTDGYEADDALGIRQAEVGREHCIICSLDKDLKQIPGRHYNWKTDEDLIVSEWLGLYTFYRHVLLGDKADNILRSPELAARRMGEVKVDRVLEGCETEDDFYNTARDLYANDGWFHRNCQLVHVLRSEDDRWQPPVSLGEGTQRSSSQVMVKGIDPSLGPTTSEVMINIQPDGSLVVGGQTVVSTKTE